MEYRYEIDADGSLWVYDSLNPEPFLFQPTWPHGASWGKGEAKKWAEQLILSMTDLTADLPGDSPDRPTNPRPVEDTSA